MSDFLLEVRQKCKAHGITFYEGKGKYIKLSGNIKCGGYFDHTNKVLAYASKHPIALAILAHETCHLDQWLENPKKFESYDEIGLIDEWLSGKKVSNKRLDNAIYLAMELELDCEKRTARKIKKYNLPIDLPNYIRRANVYVYFYLWLRKTRRWSKPNNSPYQIDEIINSVPSRFLKDYSKLPSKLEFLFDKYNI